MEFDKGKGINRAQYIVHIDSVESNLRTSPAWTVMLTDYRKKNFSAGITIELKQLKIQRKKKSETNSEEEEEEEWKTNVQFNLSSFTFVDVHYSNVFLHDRRCIQLASTQYTWYECESDATSKHMLKKIREVVSEAQETV